MGRSGMTDSSKHGASSLLSIADVARLTGLPASTLYERIEAGSVPAMRAPSPHYRGRSRFVIRAEDVAKIDRYHYRPGSAYHSRTTNAFGALLRPLRMEHNVSLEELDRACNLGKGSWSKMERGKVNTIGPRNIAIAATLMGLSDAERLQLYDAAAKSERPRPKRESAP